MGPTLKTRLQEPIPLAGDEVAQAVEVLRAGGAALEVGVHAGDPRLGRLAGERQLDVAVELLEALLAGQLRGPGAEDPAQDGASFLVALHRVSSPSVPTRKPRSASASRSLRRASCRFL